MIAEDAIQTPDQSLPQETEVAYDATVRADIELFRSYAEKYMAGQLTDDAFRAQRLRRGIYTQRQAGVHMIRTKVPGGILTDQFKFNEHPQMQFAASAPSEKFQHGKPSAKRRRGDMGDPDGCNLQCPQDN